MPAPIWSIGLSWASGAAAPGVLFGKGRRARLIFVIGVPQRLINDYLICVGTLARLVKDDVTRAALLHAKTPRQLLDALLTA
jgi:mannitol/fructose-specific phosphotransferase system IIA component (Ntr-type)